MKLSLVVLTPGKMEGKSIPITIAQFLIGRDPQCNLRPASALISKRHCALLTRGNRVFVRDFESTNGTRVNDQPVKGEQELFDQDQLSVGPLLFRVVLEASPAISQPTPMPPTASAGSADDEAAAAMLLSVQDEPAGTATSTNVDSEGVPTGSTVMDIITPPSPTPPAESAAGGGAERERAAKTASGNTSSAAKAILEKYMRRPRT
ncbi:MAG TPA: FHA domain-containing protein [Gemmataceae bacterium]|nr:FHA domain-containing protein [Gemmataceae bacterium]